MRWRYDVEIDRDLASAEWVSLESFRWRASEFLENIEDLKLPSTLHGSMIRHNVNGHRVEKGHFSTNVWPGRFRAKSIFMDFRPLILNKGNDSRSSLRRTKNIVARSTNDATLRRFVEDIASGFLSETTELSVDSRLAEKDRALSIEALLDLWMNTYYFHSGTVEQVRKARDVLAVFEREGIEQLLFFELVRIAHLVRCMFAVVQSTQPSSPYFACPDARLVAQLTVNDA